MPRARRILRRTGLALLISSLLLATVTVLSVGQIVARSGARSITEVTAGGVHVTWNPRRTGGVWPWQGWRPVRARPWSKERLWGLPRRGVHLIGGWSYIIVPLGPPTIALGAGGGLCVLASVKWRRRKPGGCRECGYDLAGLAPGSVCPESGAG